MTGIVCSQEAQSKTPAALQRQVYPISGGKKAELLRCFVKPEIGMAKPTF